MLLRRNLTLLILCMLTITCVAIQAQTSAITAKPLQQRQVHPENQGPVGCNGNCLWYSGDTDFSNEDWDALFNGSEPNYYNDYAQVWVPFMASNNSNGWLNYVKITSITFNEITYSAPDVTAMTYAFKVGVAEDNGGTTFLSGDCNYFQPTATGRSGSGFTEYAYTCILPEPVYIETGFVYWVNVNPTISNSDSGIYLSDAIDSPELNHIGWGDILDDSYVNGIDFEVSYYPAQEYGFGLEEFSVGMTGSYVHETPRPRI